MFQEQKINNSTQTNNTPPTAETQIRLPSTKKLQAAEPRSTAIQKLNNALDSIPANVATVKQHREVKEAKKVFVVIREMHHSEQLPEDMQQSANRCQAQVFDILKRLSSSLGAIQVQKDGMDPKMAESYQERIAHIYKHADLAKTLVDQLGTKTSAETFALQKKLKDAGAEQKIINGIGFLAEYQQNREMLFEEAKNDAAINMALRRSISLAGPEDAALVEQSLDLAKENPLITIDDPKFSELSKKREAHVIEEVVKNKDSVVVSIFGGSHEFIDEIKEWNKKNPNNKIGLIEITTAEYKKVFGDTP